MTITAVINKGSNPFLSPIKIKNKNNEIHNDRFAPYRSVNGEGADDKNEKTGRKI